MGSGCFGLLLLLPLFGLPEPTAKAKRVPKKLENMRPVGEPIEQGCGEMFLAHHAIPIAKFEIGGNDEGTAFLECRTELEEEIGSITGEGDETKLIQDEQLVLPEQREIPRQFQFVLG